MKDETEVITGEIVDERPYRSVYVFQPFNEWFADRVADRKQAAHDKEVAEVAECSAKYAGEDAEDSEWLNGQPGGDGRGAGYWVASIIGGALVVVVLLAALWMVS